MVKKLYNLEMETFSSFIKSSSSDAWDKATNHRFTKELMTDTLSDEVYKKYLIQDYIFIETLVTVIGKALTLAPGMESKKNWSAFLYAITSDENNYFLRSFDVLGITKEERENSSLLPTIQNFSKLMLDIANKGSYAELLAIIYAAELVYLTWASKATKPYPKRFYLSEWIELHNNSHFIKTVTWISTELDSVATDLSIEKQIIVTDLFNQLVKLEVSFFDAVYE